MFVKLLISLPTWAMAIFVCAIALGLTTLVQTILHQRWHSESRTRLNEVAGFLIAVVGVIYAVLLASIAILVLERHQRAELAVEIEAGQLSDLFVTANGLPNAATSQLRELIRDYANTVVDEEWPKMVQSAPEGAWQDKGWELTDSIDKLLTSIEPTTESQKVVLGAALSQFDDVSDARRERLFTTGSGIAAVVWAVVIAGGVVTVSLALFFGLPSWRGHLLMANMLALSIALVFVLIIAMNRPFVGDSGVTPEPFQRAMARMAGVDEP